MMQIEALKKGTTVYFFSEKDEIKKGTVLTDALEQPYLPEGDTVVEVEGEEGTYTCQYNDNLYETPDEMEMILASMPPKCMEEFLEGLPFGD